MKRILRLLQGGFVRHRCRQARAVSALASICIVVAGCTAREQAPDFDYTLLDGSVHRTPALRGQVVLVNFWATSCAVCVAEMPALTATHRRYAGRGLRTLAVAMRHDAPAAVAAFTESRQLPFDVVIDNTGSIAAQFADLRGTPTAYLIDKRGAIVWRHIGQPDFGVLNRTVERLLDEAA